MFFRYFGLSWAGVFTDRDHNIMAHPYRLRDFVWTAASAERLPGMPVEGRGRRWLYAYFVYASQMPTHGGSTNNVTEGLRQKGGLFRRPLKCDLDCPKTTNTELLRQLTL